MTSRDAYLIARRIDASRGQARRDALAELKETAPERWREFDETYSGTLLFRPHWRHCAETAMRMIGLVAPTEAVERLITELKVLSEEERETVRHCAQVVLHEGARGCAIGEVSVWRTVLADGESWSVTVGKRSMVFLQRGA